MQRENLSTNRKALKINLEPYIYGSFAEIGAGQEVARCFFQAGGASGTIAKTISAYDMAFSDSIYGKRNDKRYVCEDRLSKMLHIEYENVTHILADTKEAETKFFAFANTVSTLNYNKNNEAHGWVGMRFQLNPHCEPNEVCLHVRMLEDDNLLQQKSLGILGVNLIYACFNHWQYPNTFIQSLLDNLSRERIEITLIKMDGPELDYVDNRLLSVQLVKNNMTPATMFDRYGKVHAPIDMLYKKNVLAFRGNFRPITYVGFDMLKSSYALFKKDENYDKDNTMAFCEITLNNLLVEGDFDERDFLDRVDMLNGMGQNVMVSNLSEYYKLVSYFSRFNLKNLRVVIGIPTFTKVLDTTYYKHLKGGIFEAFGKMFPENMKLYVYPTVYENSQEIITSRNIDLPEEIIYLYKHLVTNRKILDIKHVNEERLYISQEKVLKMLQNDEEGWEKLVPKYIEKEIKEKKLFGYKGSA